MNCSLSYLQPGHPSAMSLQSFIRLNTGALMPRIGLGTYSPSGEAVQSAVDFALHVGYRHIDAAASYKNQGQIGIVLEDNMSGGRVKRKDLFVTTKVPPALLAPKDIKACVEESLSQLRLTSADLLLVHSPYTLKNRGDGDFLPRDSSGKLVVDPHDLCDIWTEFEKVYEQGLAKAIGVSNFTTRQLNLVMNKCKVRPANLQLECHAYLQQDLLRQYCKERDIVVTGYAPIGSADRPEKYRLDDDPVLLDDPVINKIAQDLKKTPAQILLRYLLQLNVTPLPKSVTPARIQENFRIFDFELDPDAMSQIKRLGERQMKYFKFRWYSHHPEYPAAGEEF